MRYFFRDVMAAFEKSGWTWVDADRAFEDPIFQERTANCACRWELSVGVGR